MYIIIIIIYHLYSFSFSGKTIYLLQGNEDVTKERAGFSRRLLMRFQDNSYISSLAPADFDGDSQMDILVTRKKDGASKSDPVSVEIYWGNSRNNSLEKFTVLKINTTFKDQPSVIDINGDMIPDLIGETVEPDQRSFIIFTNKTRNQ